MRDEERKPYEDILYDELLARSPLALAIAKRSFNTDTEHMRGTALAGLQAVSLYYDTDEAKETSAAFRDFEQHPQAFSHSSAEETIREALTHLGDGLARAAAAKRGFLAVARAEL